MRLQHKVWSLTAAIIFVIMALDILTGYYTTEENIRTELQRDALDIRSLLMATRRVYHKQFMSSGLPVNDQTVGFLPAHALARISKDFPNWSNSGLKFNNVSDRPRNPDNRADKFELDAMAYFRANPKAEERLVEIQDTDGKGYYHFTAPIWIEAYCLTCHGDRANAPATIASEYTEAYGYKLGDLRGVMSIKLPTHQLRYAEHQEWMQRFVMRLIGYVVLLLALGSFMNRLVIRRLAKMDQATKALADGNYAIQNNDNRSDEIGRLARSFNRMAAEIQERTASLQESEERFRIATENIREAFVLVDGEKGDILFWNKAAEVMFGYSRVEVISKPIHTLIAKVSSQDTVEAGLHHFAESGYGTFIGKTTEQVGLHKDGHEIPLEISISPMQIQGKWMAAGVIRDLTLVRHSQQLVIDKQVAEQSNVAKSAFLANVSHEIRTPLNAITGMAHLMRREGVSASQSDRLNKIEAAGQHLLEIINAVLDLSKIEANRFVLESVEVNPCVIAANVASMMFDNARAKGIELRVDSQPCLHHLLGDPTRIRQALLNYVSNAIKFTKTGHVIIRVRITEVDAEGVLVRYEVEDTGIGISADVVPKLFASFEQADNSTTRQYGGTGLGLAVTRKIALLMGGDAGVTTTLGEGSTFWLSIRLVKTTPTPDTAKPVLSADSAEEVLRRDYAQCRVLLVEDEPINREVSLGLIADVFNHVDVAEDGLAAIELAGRSPYDLILMDMQMPRMDGLEATRAIRQLPGGADIPIIAMTANAFSEDSQRCLDAGMNDFLSKPVIAEVLFATVLTWLSKVERRA